MNRKEIWVDKSISSYTNILPLYKKIMDLNFSVGTGNVKEKKSYIGTIGDSISIILHNCISIILYNYKITRFDE